MDEDAKAVELAKVGSHKQVVPEAHTAVTTEDDDQDTAGCDSTLLAHYAPPPDPAQHFRTTLAFWAVMYPAFFLLTFIPAAVVTYTATEYNRQTDFIWGFFGVFNPCMYFDHYPANVVATPFVSLWMVAGVGYLFVLFLIVYHMKNQLFTAMTGMLFAFVAFADVSFINILTANIYVDYPNEENLPCCNDPMTVVLNQTTIDRISMHGGFYNVTLAFDLLLCLWLIGSVKHLFHPYKVPAWVYALLVGNILVQVVAIESMLTVIMAGGVSTDAYQNREDWSTLQKWSVDIKAAIYVGHWNWILALVWRLFVPRGLGIRFDFHLGDAYRGLFCGTTDLGCATTCAVNRPCGKVKPPTPETRNTTSHFTVSTTHPRKIIATVFKILAMMLLFTYLLQDPTKHSDVSLRISAGFRELPYTYIFAPMWIIITMMTAFGVWTSILQRKLECQAKQLLSTLDADTAAGKYTAKDAAEFKARYKPDDGFKDAFSERRILAMSVVGGLWIFCMLCNLFIIVPQFDASIVAAYATLAVIPLWVLVAYFNWDSRYGWRTIVWVVLWAVLSPLSTVNIAPALLLLVLMMLIPYLDPGARGLQVRTAVTHAGFVPEHDRSSKGGRSAESDALP